MLCSFGFSEFNDRQYAIWDTRNFAEPLVMKKLDNRACIGWLHWDGDTNIMYVINKGMALTDYFYYNEDKGQPNLKIIDTYKGDGEVHGMGFIPKRQVNFMESEVNRGIRYTKTSA